MKAQLWKIYVPISLSEMDHQDFWELLEVCIPELNLALNLEGFMRMDAERYQSAPGDMYSPNLLREAELQPEIVEMLETVDEAKDIEESLAEKFTNIFDELAFKDKDESNLELPNSGIIITNGFD